MEMNEIEYRKMVYRMMNESDENQQGAAEKTQAEQKEQPAPAPQKVDKIEFDAAKFKEKYVTKKDFKDIQDILKKYGGETKEGAEGGSNEAISEFRKICVMLKTLNNDANAALKVLKDNNSSSLNAVMGLKTHAIGNATASNTPAYTESFVKFIQGEFPEDVKEFVAQASKAGLDDNAIKKICEDFKTPEWQKAIENLKRILYA